MIEYKRQSWQTYGRKAKVIDVNVKDSNGQTIEQVKLEKGRDFDNERMLKRIRKHGFNLSIEKDIDIEKEKVDFFGKNSL